MHVVVAFSFAPRRFSKVALCSSRLTVAHRSLPQSTEVSQRIPYFHWCCSHSGRFSLLSSLLASSAAPISPPSQQNPANCALLHSGTGLARPLEDRLAIVFSSRLFPPLAENEPFPHLGLRPRCSLAIFDQSLLLHPDIGPARDFCHFHPLPPVDNALDSILDQRHRIALRTSLHAPWKSGVSQRSRP